MKENFTNAQSDPLYEAATKILSGQIDEGKKVTSEKSQFGGFRPKIVNGDGSIFFLGSQAFKTSQGAEKAAQYYLDQYEKGVNVRNIKMMKGDYVKESDSLTELAMKFAIVDTTDGTVVATASDEKNAKRIISSAHLPPLSIKDSSKLEIVKTKKTAEVGYPLQEVTKGKLVDILKKEGWKSMDMKDLDDAIRKAKVNTPLGDVIGAWSKADKIVLFYDDGTSDFVSLRDKKITSTKDLWFGNPSKLTEESYRTPRYPLVYKTMKTVEDLDQDELEEFLLTLSNYISNGDFSEIGDTFDDRLYDEVGAHLFRAAKVWKNRYNK